MWLMLLLLLPLAIPAVCPTHCHDVATIAMLPPPLLMLLKWHGLQVEVVPASAPTPTPSTTITQPTVWYCNRR
jgi:hypothetical protein